MTGSRGKALLAMSGGVDSSVAAALLRQDGWDVVGCFMRLGSPGETVDALMPADACDPRALKLGKQGCCSVGDAHDAKLVAAELGIPLYVCNFKRDFGRIMDYFVAEHVAGRTPNPCVRCNDWLKFGKLHDYARQIGADVVASGHHARILHDASGAQLHRGVDLGKDQSYVLFGAPRHRLDEMLLPVGEMTKDDVRSRATELGLPVFDKPDSQEICFVPDNDHAGFVERRAPELRVRGRILDTAGRTIGEHDGHHRFTIGQRRGVGVAVGKPIYVVNKDPESNTIVVGDRTDLAVSELDLRELNWHIDATAGLGGPIEVLVQFRAHGDAACAIVEPGSERESAVIRFDEPQFGVAPGQAAVFYDPKQPSRVLGGGWIVNCG